MLPICECLHDESAGRYIDMNSHLYGFHIEEYLVTMGRKKKACKAIRQPPNNYLLSICNVKGTELGFQQTIQKIRNCGLCSYLQVDQETDD